MNKKSNSTLFLLATIALLFSNFLSVQKANASDAILNWQQAPDLAQTTGDGAIFILNNKLYYAGGWNGDSYNPNRNIYFILLTQGIPDSWVHLGQLPVGSGSFGFGVVKHNSRIYLIGGYSGSEIVDKIFSFDGASWRAERNLPRVLNFPGVEVVNGRLYIVGGLPGPINNASSTLINGDGTLGEWRSETPLPLAVTARLVGWNNCLFAIGGKDTGAVIHSEVYGSVLGPDGSISSWTSSGLPQLPEALSLNNVIVHGQTIYVFGGETEPSNTYSNKVYFTNIANDCSLSPWQNANLPNDIPRGRSSVAESEDGFYLIGGISAGLTFLKDFWYSLFNSFPVLKKGWNKMAWTNFNESQIPGNCFRFGHINNNYWNSYTKNFSLPSVSTVIFNPRIFCQ